MPHNEHTRDITLDVTDGDGQTIVYSAQGVQPDDPDYDLKTQLGLVTYFRNSTIMAVPESSGCRTMQVFISTCRLTAR